MEHFFNTIRFWDYHVYITMHGAAAGRPWLDNSYLFFARYGIVIILLSFIYLIWQQRILAFVCSFIALAISAAFSLFISLFWKRPRPFISHSDSILAPITHGMYATSVSFPSAHTFFSFAIATSVYLYGHHRLGGFLYVVAFLVAIGRIGTGLHYPSDTIAGALIGIIAGLIAFRFVESSQKKWD